MIRIVRAIISIDAEDPSGDETIDRVLKQLGLILLANGHQNVIGAELITKCDRDECAQAPARAPADPNMN
jgi:hypothetical protein